MTARVRVEGNWPEPITLRKGWARAESRPWNEVIPMAHLRLVRGGGAPFITDCVETLRGVGATAVLSPPLTRSAQKTWCEAAFEHHADLALLRRNLDQIPPPGHLVLVGGEEDLEEALRIDAEAFEDFWRFDRRAMEEAIAATPHSVLHVVRSSGGGLAGFAVSGAGSSIAYLQRLAVDPSSQGRGIGRSLVRSSARWARRMGSRVLMLNTQVDNESAIALYESEGFVTLDEPLAVLKSAG
ncbi:MAG TPA: GNAT family N-acetyltransferase [Acidimicrobiia bacterium]|nr:GNAT family N-acetyltransferase [Acidimicrobiia bacterium]